MLSTAMALVSLLQSNCHIAVIEIGDRPLKMEVANTSDERSRGLMRRSALEPFDGMIFAYDSPHHVRFWMKDTQLPLDMFFFDSDGRLVSLHRNATPFDRTPIDGGNNVQYVVEVEAGKQVEILAAHNPLLELNACNSL
ncbi:DUF192 domain-containing protein [Rhizobium binae]|uniref:DUF192 domain-containing protein n=1 Tax=Rhizobium binae TaxID=1138190 RepID=UPI001C828157|nr:DUF192 domain-containing protein [Rhizobium binae]MBX4967734.1 DUF192 domain-containing protein [Rhizobium binae]